mgnify:FL=1
MVKPSEEELDKSAKEFGLNQLNSVSEFFGYSLFHGDFGHSINFSFLFL